MLAGMAGGAAAVGLVVAPRVAGAPQHRKSPERPFEGRRRPLIQADVAQWTSEIGSTFYVGTEAGALALKLVSVAALPHSSGRPAALRSIPFEAVFEAEGNRTLPVGDRTYPVRHPEYRDLHLFFSHTGTSLRAIFN